MPFKRPYVTSQGVALARFGLIVSIKMDDGIEGLGEASPVGAGSEAEVAHLAGLLPDAAAALLQRTTDEALTAVPGMLEAGPATAIVRFGLETALLDIWGKRTGRPIAVLLGAGPRSIAVNALVSAQHPDEAAGLALQAVAEGFTSLKLKLAGTSAEDVAAVRAVRAAVGPDVRIRVDANAAWTEDDAVRRIKALEASNIEYVEQPTAAGDLAAMARVRAAVRVPLGADESLATLDDARRIAEAGAADVLVIKAARAGGLKPAAAIATMGARNGLVAVVTTSLESGVGIAATLHLAAVTPATGPASGLATVSLLQHDLLTARLPIAGGHMAVPIAPGLGVELDHNIFDRYSLRQFGSVTA